MTRYLKIFFSTPNCELLIHGTFIERRDVSPLKKFLPAPTETRTIPKAAGPWRPYHGGQWQFL